MVSACIIKWLLTVNTCFLEAQSSTCYQIIKWLLTIGTCFLESQSATCSQIIKWLLTIGTCFLESQSAIQHPVQQHTGNPARAWSELHGTSGMLKEYAVSTNPYVPWHSQWLEGYHAFPSTILFLPSKPCQTAHSITQHSQLTGSQTLTQKRILQDACENT